MLGPSPNAYGAAESDGAFRGQKKGGSSFHMKSVGFLVAPPFLMFALMDLTFAFLSGTHMPLAIVLAALCIGFASLLFTVGKSSVSGPIYMFVSCLCFIATFVGIMSGLSIQARFYAPYYNYHHRPIYTDVLATNAGDAYSDGGIIGFANNAIVDTFRSGTLLSQRGDRFCVAPILDESQQTRAEFWAVGMDCCEGRIGFYCDDTHSAGAKTGAVVFDTDSYFVRDPYAKFQEAVKQSAARNGLEIPKRPVLVRWVKDPETVSDAMWRDGTLHLATGILFYGIASMLVGLALHASTSAMSR